MTRSVISTTQAPAAIGPYSQAITAGNLVFCSGQLGLDPATGSMVDGGTTAETRQALTNMKHILSAKRLSMDNVVRTTVYLVDLNDFAAMNAVYAEFFAHPAPARTTIQVAALPKGGRVEIDAIAVS